MAMLPEINCPGCRTRLQIPPGAAYVRCIFCNTTASTASPLRPASPHLYPGRPNDWNYAPSYPPAPTWRKKAVVCGITYQGKWWNGDNMQLNGPANDANNMKYLLQRRYGFTELNIFLLTDDRVNHNGPYDIPTRANIIHALHWLVDGCHPGDSLVFHFSGHGDQRQDNDGDERDGMDECILPLDFDVGNGGVILDDEINKLVVNVLPHGVKLHAIIDACHSGTVLDLPYLCRMHRFDMSFSTGEVKEWDIHSGTCCS